MAPNSITTGEGNWSLVQARKRKATGDQGGPALKGAPGTSGLTPGGKRLGRPLRILAKEQGQRPIVLAKPAATALTPGVEQSSQEI